MASLQPPAGSPTQMTNSIGRQEGHLVIAGSHGEGAEEMYEGAGKPWSPNSRSKREEGFGGCTIILAVSTRQQGIFWNEN